MTNMASSLAEIAPAASLIFRDECLDEARELIRLLHLDAMPGRAHELEPRLREQGGITLSCAARYDLVVVAPDNKRRSAHPAEQMRQALIVHVGLPGDPEAHLAAQIPSDQLVGRDIAVDPSEGVLVVKTGAGVIEIADDRLVEDIAVGRLQA